MGIMTGVTQSLESQATRGLTKAPLSLLSLSCILVWCIYDVVYVCIVYMFSWGYVYVLLQAYDSQRLMLWHLAQLPTLVSETVSLTEPGLSTQLWWLANKLKTLPCLPSSSPLLNAGMTDMLLPLALHRYWASKPKSSCSYRRHLPTEPSPNPWNYCIFILFIH